MFCYLSHAFYIFILFFLTKEILNFFPFMEYIFQFCEQNVGAGMNTLISISDGLGLSIPCRKMDTTRPMREEMDERVVLFCHSRHSHSDVFFKSTFPYLYLDLACKQLCFLPGKCIIRKNESTIKEQLFFCKFGCVVINFEADDSTQYSGFSHLHCSELLKNRN